MSDVTLNVTRTETYTIELSEADIREICDRQGYAHEGMDLEKLLESVGRQGFTGEALLAALADGQDADREEWVLNDWETDDDE